MANRRGEKIGWTAGWMGGFIWVAILSMVFLFQEKHATGLAGLILFGAAVVGILKFSPWRHPSTPYWKLMAVPYGLFIASAAWALWAYGDSNAAGLNGWSLLWFLPMLIPVASLGRRRWSDSDPGQSAPPDTDFRSRNSSGGTR